MSRVLIVEDEAHLAEGLRFNLEAEGHSVEVAGDGETAISRLLGAGAKIDAVVLDVMLPGMDGFAVATALRKAKNYVPVLMLTARGRPEDVLAGFAAGTDDYLPKPFELPIFLARLQGLLRRSAWLSSSSHSANQKAANGKTETSATNEDMFSLNGRTIDFGNLELRTKDTTIQLTLMEAKLSAPSDPQQAAKLYRGSPFWRMSGVCARTRTLAPSTISSFACGVTSKKTPPNQSICSPCAALDTDSSGNFLL